MKKAVGFVLARGRLVVLSPLLLFSLRVLPGRTARHACADVRQLDDVALMDCVSTQHQDALAELYKRYGSWVYSLALRVVQNDELAEEITQDIFLKVWNRASTWDPDKGKLGSWLLAVTRYAAIDRIRQEQRQPPQAAMSWEDAAPFLSHRSAVDTALWADGQILQAAMAKLPEEQMQVIELAYYQGMTHKQIAQSLELPLGTVKTRVRLGLQKLRHLWKEAHESEKQHALTS